MATGLGLRVGTYESVAAVVTESAEAEPEYIVRDTVLYMNADGDSQLGGTVPDDSAHTVTGFLAKVGDPAGVVVGEGHAYRPEDLVATAMFGLIEAASPHLTAPSEIYATYPAQWSDAAVAALRDALDYLGLRSVQVMSEADAAVAGGDEPAHGAALAALAAAGGAAATEEFPVAAPLSTAGPMVIAPAYSALADPPTPLPVAAPVAARFTFARFKETPILLAAGVAAFVAVTSGVIAVALDREADTAVPEIQAAAPVTTVQQVAPALPPAVLPTVAPAPEPVLAETAAPEPVVVPVFEEPQQAPPPVPVVTEAPAEPPVTTDPPVTTTVAPTTEVTTPVPTTPVPSSTLPPATTPPVQSTVAPTQTRDAGRWSLDRDRSVIDYPEILIPFIVEYDDLQPFGNTTR